VNLEDIAGRLGLVVGTFVYAVVSAIVPAINTELYLAAVTALAPPSALPGVLLAASLGQVVGKLPFYLAGRGLVKLPLGRYEAKVEAYRASFERSPRLTDLALFSSASLGVPPFLVGPYLAGFFRVGLVRFCFYGVLGRLIRFAAVMLVPLALKALAR
jgi:membrane protein YqaA with SNARE-associated domain